MRKFLLLLALLISGNIYAKSYSVISPDKKSEVTIEDKSGELFISMKSKGKDIITNSPIQFTINESALVWDITASEQTKQTDKIDMLYGEFSELELKYNELTLSSKQYDTKLKVRLFDKSFAYKIEFNSLPAKTSIKENSKFLPSNSEGVFYCTNGEKEPLDPRSFTSAETFKAVVSPIVYQAKDYAFAIHECELRDYSQLMLQASATDKGFSITSQVVNTTKKQFNTPWRVMLLGNDMADIHNQKPVYQALNTPTTEDFSWVKPGISTWDWRTREMIIDGFKYDANTATFKRFIDFCSKFGIDYLLIDDRWFESTPLKAIDAIDIKEVIDYGKSKNVGIFLYYDTHYTNKSKGRAGAPLVDFDTVAKHYSELGAVGIKYGFHRDKNTQAKVNSTIKIIETCAKYKLMVDFHDGPVPFSGIERTYPNNMTREFCHAQLDTKTAFSANSFVKMACVNLLIGHIDQTNGAYMLNSMASRSKGPKNPYISTVSGENARVFISHTGSLSVIIDAPEAYANKADFFEFIQSLPRTWDETRYLEMDFMSHITVARRKGTTWYAGVAYNNAGGEHSFKLDFLKPGKKYTAKIFKDAKDSDGTTNKESYEIETKEVNSKTILKTKVAKSGGYSIIFTEK
ncbi:MAG: glycoside hydrolase family 97 catalytic domain-containing protein [Rikenellaceae bacterium]